ncbi:MAG: class I SAM-dependent methyltransferase [Nitrosopumilaceae archaeon]
MNEFTTIEKCRVCYSNTVTEVLKLGEQYVGTIFVESNEDNSMLRVKIPLTLMLCKNCGLVQLKETVKPDLLFKNYFYRTGVNNTMRRDLHDVIDYALKNVKIESGNYVLDIGANDCTMVSMFPQNLNRIALEPARNIDWGYVDKSITIVNDYFSKEVVLKVTNGKKIKIITATAMFYDFDDPNVVAKDIKSILDENGICIIQVSYLLDTLRDMNFYDVVHEHLEYYSLRSIDYLMENNGLKVIDASTNFTNGGSLRILVTHKENKISRSKRYEDILAEEKKWKLEDPQTYIQYGNKIQNVIKKLKDFILNEIKNGGLIIGLGASTKGNMLLQICEIDKKLLPYISERNKGKVGLRTLGTDIEIISEEKARKMGPSCMLVIPWNFKEEILEREKEYIQNGGKMLFLIPYLHIIDKNGERKLE